AGAVDEDVCGANIGVGRNRCDNRRTGVAEAGVQHAVGRESGDADVTFIDVDWRVYGAGDNEAAGGVGGEVAGVFDVAEIDSGHAALTERGVELARRREAGEGGG